MLSLASSRLLAVALSISISLCGNTLVVLSAPAPVPAPPVNPMLSSLGVGAVGGTVGGVIAGGVVLGGNYLNGNHFANIKAEFISPVGNIPVHCGQYIPVKVKTQGIGSLFGLETLKFSLENIGNKSDVLLKEFRTKDFIRENRFIGIGPAREGNGAFSALIPDVPSGYYRAKIAKTDAVDSAGSIKTFYSEAFPIYCNDAPPSPGQPIQLQAQFDPLNNQQQTQLVDPLNNQQQSQLVGPLNNQLVDHPVSATADSQ